jgi:teichuronic acid biosynthesis glycosyltransferase TuaC
MTNLHVLVISHMYPNSVNPMSGIFVHSQVRELSKIGIEIQVISPVPSFPIYPKWKGYRELPRYMVLDGIPVHYLPTRMFPGGFFFSSYGHSYIKVLQKQIGQLQKTFPFDLIHCHTIFPDGYAGGVLGQIFQKPVMTSIHGSDLLLYPHRSQAIYRKTVQALQMNDYIVTVSERLCKEARKMVPEVTVQTVYNGFDPKLFHPRNQQEARITLGLPEAQKVLLFAGNLLPVKGVSYLLSAFAILSSLEKNIHLYLIGEGRLRAELEQQRNKLRLQDRVTFMGRKPYEEIPIWINSADAVVLSSLNEGLSSIVLETMACGKPMVGTEVGGVPEILQDKVTGFLAKPQDPNDLARCLQKVLIDPTIDVKQLERQALDASKRFTWQENARQLKDLYEQMTKRKTG